MELERTHTHTHNTTLLCVSVLLESTGQVYGVSGRLLRLWVALIALVPLRPQHAKDNDTSPVQGLISGQHEIIQQFSCQDLGRIKIHPQLIGWAHHQTYNTGLIADSTVLPTLALCWHTTMPGYTFGWMSPFLSHLSPLDLPQLAPFPPTFPLCSLCPPPPWNHLSSSPSTLPVSRLIHRARFLSLFCESCEGNLEGLSGINLKRKRLSLLLSLALLADWVRSPGTCRLLISTTPPHCTHPPVLEVFVGAWL